MSARGIIYKELGAELITHEELPIGLVITFQDLIDRQAKWIQDLLLFVQFAPDQRTYGALDTTIDDTLTAHNSEGSLLLVSDGSVKHIHNMSFG